MDPKKIACDNNTEDLGTWVDLVPFEVACLTGKIHTFVVVTYANKTEKVNYNHHLQSWIS